MSLHGNKEIHNLLTGNSNAYESTIKSIEFLTASKISLCVEITLTSKNILDIESILKMLVRYKVKHVSLMRYVPTGRNDAEYEVSYEEFIQTLNKIIKSNENKDLKIDIPCSQKLCLDENNKPIKDENKFRDFKISEYLNGSCQAGIRWCSISVNGDLRICPHSDVYFGNIENNSLKDLWHKINYSMSSLIENSENSVCHTCNYLKKCKQGCFLNRLKNFNVGGKL